MTHRTRTRTRVRRLPALPLALAVAAALALPAAAASAASAASTPHAACVAPALPPDGTVPPVDPVTAAAHRVRTGIATFLACLDSGDDARTAALLTPHFIRDFMGQHEYRTVPAVLGGLRIERVRSGPVLAYPDGSFTTELTYLAYGHQLTRARMTWWTDPASGALQLNELRALSSPVAAHAAEVGVAMGEYFFRLDRTQVCAPGGRLVLRLRNVGVERHEAILLRLPPGATGEDLFAGRVPRDQAVTIGQENGAAELSLTGLAPGTYTLADFIPAPDGRPHGAHGQTAQFTVTTRHC